MEDLPDMVLLRIIEYIHPVERVHNLSVLSRRWNRLVKSHKLWREVRIFICDPPYYKKSVAEFLHEVVIVLFNVYHLAGELKKFKFI